MNPRIQALLDAKAPKPIGMNPDTQPTQPLEMAQPSPVLPIRKSSEEVIFKSFKGSFRFYLGNDQISFKNGYYMTSDTKLIGHIKKNFVPRSVQIIEEGSLGIKE